MSDEDREYEEAVDRAIRSGTMFLNGVFRFNDKNRQLFGTRGPRFSSLEVVWAVITAVAIVIVMMPFNLLLADKFWVFQLPFIAFYAIAGGYFGRRFANTSPLAKKTGEGTGVWVVIQIRKMSAALANLPIFPDSFRAMHNNTYTIALSPPREHGCIEWLGTARAPRMPYDYDPSPGSDQDSNIVELFPRGERQMIEPTSSVFRYAGSDYIYEPHELDNTDEVTK